MVVNAIIILSLLSSANGLETDIAFFKDLLEFYNMKYPMIICRNIQDGGLEEMISLTTPTSFISYDGDEEVEYVTDYVKETKYWGNIDSILFVGNGHQHLILTLVNHMKSFNSGITGVLHESEYSDVNLTLALNTRLFVLEEEDSLMRVEEVYAVKGMPINKIVGSWNETAGLVIDEPNIWKRRTDLNGVTLRATSLNFSTLHYLNNEVTGGGGFFIEPLFYLAPRLNFTPSFLYSSDGKWGGRDDITNMTL